MVNPASRPLFPDTIVAAATPLAESAIGIVRMSGPHAVFILEKIFRGKTDPTTWRSHQLHYGTIVTPEGKPLDDGMVVLMRAPRSYTGDDSVEFYVHGSPYIVRALVKLCSEMGAIPAPPGEFTKRAYLSGKLDLAQAEAVADLIRTKSAAEQSAFKRRISGELSDKVRSWVDRIQHLRIQLEIDIDFSDQDHSAVRNPAILQEFQLLAAETGHLADSYGWGRKLVAGWTVVIAGPPNAGKSTLFNALLGEGRSIVHERAGTTRDLVDAVREFDGMAVRLVDTAGLHERGRADPIEAEGMRRSEKILESADLILWVEDASAPRLADSKKRLHALLTTLCNSGARPAKDASMIVVANKVDRGICWGTAEFQENPSSNRPKDPNMSFAILFASATSRDDIQRITLAITERIRYGQDNDLVPLVRERERDQVEQATQLLRQAAVEFSTNVPEELVAEGLKRAQQHLLALLGEGVTVDLLDDIFSRFCIGK